MEIKNKLAAVFWKGLLTVFPIYLSFYLISWLLDNIETTFSALLTPMLGGWYFSGLGLLVFMLAIFGCGILMQLYIAEYVIGLFNSMIKKIPLIGDIYSSINSLANYFSSSKKIKEQEVVMVNVNDTELLGLVTRSDFTDAPNGMVTKKNMYSVYIPMSYQVGGFTVYVDESKIRKVDMKQSSALKWVFIGGIK